jgi:hypothetical protein
MVLGTVVATSGLVALLSDCFFTCIAYLIGKNSRLPVVKVDRKKYNWMYFFVR